MPESNHLLEVEGLKTYFDTDDGTVKSVDGVDFHIDREETLALVGESGSGKSVTSLSIMGLIKTPPGRYAGGAIRLAGRDLLRLTDREMQGIRGNDISMIFQEPMTSLNPVYTIGNQIAETIVRHQKKTYRQALIQAAEMLDLVGIPEPGKRVSNYPHEMSGGMRQRAMIAMALSCNPKLLIADEPTTALDVTIQAQVLDTMAKLQRDLGTAILFITHDLGVVAEVADRAVVMYGGQVVEHAPVIDLFQRPRMPYTLALLNSIPRIDRKLKTQERLAAIPGNVPSPLSPPGGCAFHPRCRFCIPECESVTPDLVERAEYHWARCLRAGLIDLMPPDSRTQSGIQSEGRPGPASSPISNPSDPSGPAERNQDFLLEVYDLRKWYPVGGGLFGRSRDHVQAVQDISFGLCEGEVVGLVGESGSGKTTVGRSILRLVDPTSGSIHFDGTDITKLTHQQMRRFRKEMQIIFQDPFGSLDPRRTVGDIVGEAFVVHNLARGADKRAQIASLLEKVGLSSAHMNRFPHEFSGGQRQRISIARALAVSPRFLVADEPVSALDVSIQAQVINLLQDLKTDFNLTMLFIAHDLSVVEYISDRVIVMYLGRIMEIAPVREIYVNPIHPYTEALLSAVPVPDPTVSRDRIILEGDIPSPIDPPSGCVFRTRCPIATKECANIVPSLEMVSPGHYKACIHR